MKTLLKMVLIIVFIAICVSAFFLNSYLTGNVIRETSNSNYYMYTKAICNSSNSCQDTQITCKQNKTISMVPIKGAVIQYEKDWVDPRSKEEIEKLC